MSAQTDTRLSGICAACSKPTAWHRDEKNRSLSCESAAPRNIHDRLAAALQQRQQRMVLQFEARS